jgi:hypothetical protein
MAVGCWRVVAEATVSVVQQTVVFRDCRDHVQELSVALYEIPNIRKSRSKYRRVTIVIHVGD